MVSYLNQPHYFVIINGQSQGQLYLENDFIKGFTIYKGNYIISLDHAQDILSIDPAAYKTYQKGLNKRKTGNVIQFIGGLGFGFSLISAIRNNGATEAQNALIASAGVFIVGAIIKTSGTHKMKDAFEEYNYSRSVGHFKPTIKLGRMDHGIGIALTF